MVTIDFQPFGNESIQLRFVCPSCKGTVTSESVFIPSPNYFANRASESHNCNEESAFCYECDKDFNINLCSGQVGGYIEIEGIEDDNDIEIISLPDIPEDYYQSQIESIIENSEIYKIFNNELTNLRTISHIDINNRSTKEALLRQTYSSVITCLEIYLSDTFINKVFKDQQNLQAFVSNYKDFQKEKVSLSDIYQTLGEIEGKAKKSLSDIIWHNIPKVNGIYNATFNINFPNYSSIMQAIIIRHDLVHRNGKNKNGKKIEINFSVVSDVIDKVESFVNSIETKMNNI